MLRGERQNDTLPHTFNEIVILSSEQESLREEKTMEQDRRGAQVKEMRTVPSEGDAHGGGLGRVAARGGAKTERESALS